MVPRPPDVISDRGLFVLEVLRFPHLVLADVGYDHGVAVAGLAPQVVDDVRGVEMSVVGKLLNVPHRGIAFQLVDRIQPFGVINRLDARQQLLEHFAQIADQRHVHLDVLIDFRGIDFDVDLLGVLRVGLEIAGDAIVEAHAQRQQQVGFLNRVVDPGFAVHSHHAQVQRMRSRKRSQAEQSQSDGNAGLLRQGQHFRHGARDDDAVSGEDQRPLGFVDQLQGLRVLRFLGRKIGTIPRRLRFGGFPVEFAGRLLRVFSDVDQHRTGTAGAGHVKRLAQHAAPVDRRA